MTNAVKSTQLFSNSTRRTVGLVLFAIVVPCLFILQRTPRSLPQADPPEGASASSSALAFARARMRVGAGKPPAGGAWVRPVYDADLARAAAECALTAPSGRRYVIATSIPGNKSKLAISLVRNLACSLRGRVRVLLLALDSTTTSAPSSVPPNVRIHTVRPGNVTDAAIATEATVAAILATGYDVLYAPPHTVFCASDAPNAVADAALAAGAHIATGPTTGGGTALGLYYARAVDQAMQFLTYSSYNSPKILALDPQSYPSGCTKFAGRQLRTLPNTDIDSLCRASAVKLIHYQCYKPRERVAQMRRNKMWFSDNDDVTKCVHTRR